MRFFSALLVCFLIGCTNKNSTCIETADQFLKKNRNKVYRVESEEGKGLEFHDKGVDSSNFGDYQFYEDGTLQSYKFFVDSQTYIYGEEFDKEGKISGTQGNPSVLKIAKLENDTLFVKLYLFALNKEYTSVNAVTNRNKLFDIKLKEDSSFSNMKVAEIKIGDLTDGEHIRVNFHVTYRQNCYEQLKMFGDTVAVSYHKR